MAKNERIIAQDLAELKHALQTENTEDITNLCHILKREIGWGFPAVDFSATQRRILIATALYLDKDYETEILSTDYI